MHAIYLKGNYAAKKQKLIIFFGEFEWFFPLIVCNKMSELNKYIF